MALFLMLTMLFSMTACNGSKGGSGSQKSDPAQEEDAEEGNNESKESVNFPQKHVAYMKDRELWFNNFSDDSVEVTSKLLDFDGATNESLRDASGVSYYVQMSTDGKTMFFPDKVDGKGGFTIYYRDVTDAESEAEKVDSSISGYAINAKGDKVVYIKDAEYKQIADTGFSLGTIKIGDVAETEKVASDAMLIAVNEKFDTVIYLQVEETTKKEDDQEVKAVDYTYYLWKDGEKTKICNGDISRYNFSVMNETEKTNRFYKKISKVCYLKEDVLYVHELDGEAEKIDYDVAFIEKIYASGEIFYTKLGREIMVSDCFIEDGETDDAVYYTTDDLYCYADGESTLIVEGYEYGSFAADKAVAIINYIDWNNLKKVKTSEEDYYSKHYENMENISITAVMTENALTEIEEDNVVDYVMTDDGSSIYLLCVDKEKEKDEEGNETGEEKYNDKGDIMMVTVKKGTVSTAEEYDTDVSCVISEYGYTEMGIYLNRNDDLVYYKDYNAEKDKATLVIGMEEIDTDVKPYSVSALKNGAFVYYVDWDDDAEKQCGTLRISQYGKVTTIAENVHDFMITPDNEILYLMDYNTEKYEGELYRYNDGENALLDENVISLLNIYVW